MIEKLQVDGTLPDDTLGPDDEAVAPFFIFSPDEQRNIRGPFTTRGQAQRLADYLNAEPMDLDQALDEFSVMDANPPMTGWFAVVDEDGINAYFSTQQAAYRHRLDLINRRLNG